MRRLVQIIPKNGANLYGMMVSKEVELTKKKKGTFHRSKAKELGRAKWSHAKYDGWIKLQRGIGDMVVAEVRTANPAGDVWALLQAFLGFVDRHFRDQVLAVNVQYPE